MYGLVRLAGFSDSDWAGQKLSLNSKDRCGRKSTSGYMSFSCGPTNLESKLQGIPATSSAQAEFMAMYEAAEGLLCFQILLLRELGFKLSRVPLFCDNTTGNGKYIVQVKQARFFVCQPLCQQNLFYPQSSWYRRTSSA